VHRDGAERGRLILAHKGFVWARSRRAASAAHGSRWDEGVSAIGHGPHHRRAGALRPDVLRRRTHPLLGPASLHCATIDGGDRLVHLRAGVHAARGAAHAAGRDAGDVLDELREVIASAGEEAECARC
jgi:acetylornithine deacetylase